jgi:adenylate cyclase
VLPVSSSSARKAIDQRESFIWQRGEDLSASQRDSDLCAGIYAPILAAGEVFGVICLDANASASCFTNEDLFLVTSLGHQLGLTLANRALEENLRSTAKLLERLLTNFSPQVRNRLLLKAEAGRLKLGGERSVISILCSDIRNFTILTEKMDAEEVVGMLNDYFAALVSVVFKHGGSIDKFVGDAIMAVFGSPEADIMHAENSLRAALEMQVEVRRVSDIRRTAGLPTCEIGIGVHTGEVIHGFIGSPDRMEFTVIGSAVNLSSRYCSAARGGDVIISPELLERVWKNAVVEPVEISTKHEGALSAYRLLKMRTQN